MTEAHFKATLRDWLAQKNPSVDPAAIQDDTPLIEQRLLTSIQVMDLALFIEDNLGSSLDMTRIKKGAFSSIDAIWRTFFAGVKV
ncbi:MAG: hypothetical protein VKP62_03945 [Candidatus Sericytochromatia bacterium]|nr:hypothetical protein [Candidatus Sericytochromatia bacterium]